MTPPSDWTSNAALSDVAGSLRSAASVLVLTHVKPDGDAFGSAIAAARAIAHRGGQARTAFHGPFPDRFRSLILPTDDIRFLSDDPNLDADQSRAEFEDPWFEAERTLIVDTGSWSQLSSVRTLVEPRRDRVTLVDHHQSGDDDVAAQRHVDVSAAAAAELIARLAALLLDLKTPAALPVEVATPAFLGISTDTGWFRHSSTTPATMRTAADLIEAGVDVAALRALIEQGDRPPRLELMKRALASLTRHADDRLTVMQLRRRDFAEAGAVPDDAGGLIDLPQSVADLRVSALLTERAPGITKVSMRSKAISPIVDVNAVAQHFGGGGHVHAAGATINRPIEQVTPEVIAQLEHAIAHGSRS